MPALLAADEPPAVQVERLLGKSPFFIICDHAGARIPRALGTLGLAGADLVRHIAWDIGAAGVARGLSQILDACLVLQTYSRLVIDCNRRPGSKQSIASSSELTPIPGNDPIGAAERGRREREVFEPYHERIRGLLDAREALGRTTFLVSVHSFTPVYLGRPRPWHAGVLYNRDGRLAKALLGTLRRDAALVLGENEPYAVSDCSDFAIPEYGEKRGLPHVEIEVRQDLIEQSAGQCAWAHRLAEALVIAAAGERARGHAGVGGRRNE